MADKQKTTPTRVRHKKRGTEYEVLGEADLQTEKPLRDYAVVMVYRDPATGRLWVRPVDEFNDGRFEVVT
jgi:hypothetical protein